MKKRFYKRGIFFGFVLMLLLQLGIGSAIAQEQVISVIPSDFYQSVGSEFSLRVKYNVSDSNKYLTGLGLNIYFDSKKFDYKGYMNFLDKGDMNSVPILLKDSSDEDKNQDTNMKINISWVSISSQWPGLDLPVDLANLNFKVKQEAEKGDSPINVSVFEHDADYDVILNNINVTILSQ